MHLRIVLGNRLDVTVPIHLFSHVAALLFDHLSFFIGRHRSVGTEGASESLCKVHRIDLCSQEGDLGGKIHGAFNIVHDLKLVTRLFIELEGCVVEGATHGGLLRARLTFPCKRLEACRSVRGKVAILSTPTDSCDGCFGGILTEELVVSHG